VSRSRLAIIKTTFVSYKANQRIDQLELKPVFHDKGMASGTT
jgi:ribonucleotide reductase beta subunit family protein with ferritin-like domain